MNEKDKARLANEVTEAWEQVSSLMSELSIRNTTSSELITRLDEAIKKYKGTQDNRYKQITSIR